MKRAELATRPELKWLVKSSGMDEASFIFVDEVELPYYDQFGNLKIVLVNGNKLPAKQEGLKDAVTEIFHCKEVDLQYPMVEEITMARDCSCCTLIAEMFAVSSPEILAGQGFCRLLLAGILLDTASLTNSSCTSKDKYMTTLLLKGAGRFGSNGLYELLKRKMHDISDLKVRDILRREFKKWTRVAGKPNSTGSRLSISNIGMSVIGISLEELLAHEDSAVQKITQFQESEKLRLLMIVSGYYDDSENFKISILHQREILVCAKTAELMRNFHQFFDINGTNLPLKDLDKLGKREELKAFEVNDKSTSRRSIERLFEEFGGVVTKQN
ncbi:putative exopolyphosphatase [Asparagus officinalis]|uniref:putative exopolyphosphatase n=1 Tax=Asparagus officinalis TaxID=4686 RepID=UPI00098E28D9|nr:putative exopolyphosphatase [Asparagus officinalis]